MAVVEYPVDGGKAEAYLALPGAGKGPGVIVLHAWWGLNDFFRDFCDRLAAEGFIAMAPDYYHGAIAHTIDEAERLRRRLKRTTLTKELVGAVKTLSNHPSKKGAKVGVIGFSLGAYWAPWLADSDPAKIGAVVLFYGLRHPRESRAPILGHFAEVDEYTPIEEVKEYEKSLRSSGREATIYVYPKTRHWFFEKDRPNAYNADAARLALARTVEFLHNRLD